MSRRRHPGKHWFAIDLLVGKAVRVVQVLKLLLTEKVPFKHPMVADKFEPQIHVFLIRDIQCFRVIRLSSGFEQRHKSLVSVAPCFVPFPGDGPGGGSQEHGREEGEEGCFCGERRCCLEGVASQTSDDAAQWNQKEGGSDQQDRAEIDDSGKGGATDQISTAQRQDLDEQEHRE